MVKDLVVTQPTLFLLAGPNGSGKSTIAYTLRQSYPALAYISADDLATTQFKHIADAESRHYDYATQQAEADVLQAIAHHTSLIFETVLSSDYKWHLLDAARQAGMKSASVFVSTCNVQINLARVGKRVQAGGHDVPADKVISRYARSMARLGKLILMSDECYVYDNSIDGQKPTLQFAKVRNEHFLVRGEGAFSWVGALYQQWCKEGICTYDNTYGINMKKMRMLDMQRYES